MSGTPQPSLARTLATIHKVITRGIEVTRSRSQSFAEEGLADASLRSGFISYARTFVSLTHAHHDTEDVLIFPYAQEKMPETSFDLLIAQHREIASLLGQMNAAIDEAEKTPQAAESLSRISRLAAQIGEIWQAHIREEETIFSPERVARRSRQRNKAGSPSRQPHTACSTLGRIIWQRPSSSTTFRPKTGRSWQEGCL